MSKPASQADLVTQRATDVYLNTGDIEQARRSKVVLLNLIDDQSRFAVDGVQSFTLQDLEDISAEDTKTDGTAQSDLSGGTLPTTLTIDKFKTVPAYFKYVLGESSRINWVENFLNAAPEVAVLEVEKAAIAALRGIGATNYIRLGGTASDGTVNAVPTVANYTAALKILVQDKKLNPADIRSIGSFVGQYELPSLFGYYNSTATGADAEFAKLNGFIRMIMGVPNFASHEIRTKEHIIFHKRAVAYAIRTKAKLVFQAIGSQSQDYYGVNISYGVVARQDKRAVVMQDGAAFVA